LNLFVAIQKRLFAFPPFSSGTCSCTFPIVYMKRGCCLRQQLQRKRRRTVPLFPPRNNNRRRTNRVGIEVTSVKNDRITGIVKKVVRFAGSRRYSRAIKL